MHDWDGMGIAEGMRLGMRVIRSSVIIFRPHSSEVRFYSIILLSSGPCLVKRSQ